MKYHHLVLLLLLPLSMVAQRQEINDYLYRLYQENRLMASVAVSEQNKLVYTGAQGLLHPEASNQTANEYTFYRVGTFGALLTKLVAHQMVAVDSINRMDTVSYYLPRFQRDSAVTIAQLIDHNSGIADYLESEAVVGKRSKNWSERSLVTLLREMPQMYSAGGKPHFSYSNTVLLSLVLEAAAKQPIASLYNQYLLDEIPGSSFQTGETPSADKNEAGSFRFNGTDWEGESTSSGSLLGPGGSFMLQAKDFGNILSQMFQYKYFHPNEIDWYTKNTANDGSVLRQYSINNKMYWGWEGVTDGMRIVSVVQPKTLRTITICGQAVNINLEQVLTHIDLLLDGEEFYDPQLAPRKLQGGQATRYTGMWKNRAGEDKLNISLVDGHLLVRLEDQDPFPLFPASDQRFTYPSYGVSVTFKDLTGDNYNQLEITQGSKRITFER